MYKLLLCLKYLQTRYLAFICIVSVMLGVATLIVVNSVMSGFSTKLKDRLHGVLSDVVIDTDNMAGFHDPDRPDADGRPTPIPPAVMIERIQASPAGGRIAAITPTIEIIGILQFHFRGQVMTKPVKLIGIDPVGRAAVGGFSEYLVRQKGEAAPSFDLTPEALQHLDWNRKRRERENALVVPGVPSFIPVAGPVYPVADVVARRTSLRSWAAPRRRSGRMRPGSR